jgi:hypothetical protein
MRRTLVGAAAATLLVALGCTWVALTPEAADVRIAAAEDLGECKRIAKTTASVKDKLGFISRNAQKVKSELETLARNEAVREGGDAIAPLSQVQEGRQEFAIYSCAPEQP